MKSKRQNSNFYKLFLNLSLLLIIIICSNSKLMSTTTTITVNSNFFTPANASVNVGDTVKWQWIGGNHNTTSSTIPGGAAPWAAPMNSGSTTFIYKVTVAGNYNYTCTFHPGMNGLITASPASGTSLLTENFEYPAGDSLGAHGWVSFSGGSTNVLSVVAPGLVYSGYALSNIGNATKINLTGQDAYKNFSSPDSVGNLYVSFMISVASAQAGDYFFALLPATSTTLYTSRFWAKDSLGNLAFGLSKSTAAAGGIFYTGGNYSYGTTYLIVLKYTFNTGTTTDDVLNAYIFNTGVPATEPGTSTLGPITGTANDNALGRIALRQGTTGAMPVANVDGFSVNKLWTGLTGVKNISNLVTEDFSLNQNYPNPFNPNTTIKFSLPENGFVNLTVYNSIGREVANLVNENVNSGTYSADFNGSNLTSGVYFYKLTFSGKNGISYTDTKKLILLK